MDILEAKSILDDCLEELPEVDSRPAFGFPCLFVRGKVFGLYDGDFIVLRFEETVVSQLVAIGEGYPFTARANIASSRSWVKIAHDQMDSSERLRDLIILSYRTRVGLA